MTQQKKFDEFLAALKINGELFYAGTVLQRAAKKWPEKIALIFQKETISYKELYKCAVGVSRKLEKQGIKPRDRIILLYENSIDFYIAYYGIWQMGAVVVPVNTFLKEQELHHIIHDAKPAALIVSVQQKNKIPNNKELTFPPIFDETFIARDDQEQELDYLPKTLTSDELSVLLYTSGTTGLPKGVMLSSRNIIMNVAQGRAALNISYNERILAALPLFHSFLQNTCLWGAVIVGATTIIVAKIERRLLYEGLDHKPTIILGVPGLYGLFCMLKQVNFDQVNYFICGGDALPDKIRSSFALMYKRKLCNGYGLTESSPFVCINLEDMTLPTNVVGKPLIQVKIEIRDDAGQSLNAGNIGTLWVGGPQVMLGYYNEPEESAKVIKNGWLNTGDLAAIDKYGNITLCGREKDIIINKGFKIYPQESENILMLHSQVLMVAVVGIKEVAEEIPIAFLVVKEHSNKLIDELKKLCVKNLAPYKIPRQFFIERELPLTATGKVDKKLLRARFNKSL